MYVVCTGEKYIKLQFNHIANWWTLDSELGGLNPILRFRQLQRRLY